MNIQIKTTISGNSGLFAVSFEHLENNSKAHANVRNPIVLTEITDDWSELPFDYIAFLNTNAPTLGIFVEHRPRLFIKKTDIHSRCVGILPSHGKQFPVVVTDYFLDFFKTTKCAIIQLGYVIPEDELAMKRAVSHSCIEPYYDRSKYVTFWVPNNFKQSKNDWNSLGLAPCSNLESIPAKYVAKHVAKHTCSDFNHFTHRTWPFPYMPMEELEAKGIKGKLFAFSNEKILLSSIFFKTPEVIQPFFPDLQQLAGKLIIAGPDISKDNWASLIDVLECPHILDHQNTVVVSTNESELLKSRLIHIPENVSLSSVPIPLKFVVEFYEDEVYLFASTDCSKQFLVSSIVANSNYILPEDLPSHYVFNEFDQVYRNIKKFYFKKDIKGLPRKDKNSAKMQKEERRKRLIAIHGELPKNWHKFSDEQIAEHMKILKMFENGEILFFGDHELVATFNDNQKRTLLQWLCTNELIIFDRLSFQYYLPKSVSIDDFAKYPDFVELLKKQFGAWTISLTTSNKVRNAVMAELL